MALPLGVAAALGDSVGVRVAVRVLVGVGGEPCPHHEKRLPTATCSSSIETPPSRSASNE